MGRSNFRAKSRLYQRNLKKMPKVKAPAAAPSELICWACWPLPSEGEEVSREMKRRQRILGRTWAHLMVLLITDHWSQQPWWAFSRPSVMGLRLHAAPAPEPRQQKEGNDWKAHRRTARKWDFRLFPTEIWRQSDEKQGRQDGSHLQRRLTLNNNTSFATIFQMFQSFSSTFSFRCRF